MFASELIVRVVVIPASSADVAQVGTAGVLQIGHVEEKSSLLLFRLLAQRFPPFLHSMTLGRAGNAMEVGAIEV